MSPSASAMACSRRPSSSPTSSRASDELEARSSTRYHTSGASTPAPSRPIGEIRAQFLPALRDLGRAVRLANELAADDLAMQRFGRRVRSSVRCTPFRVARGCPRL